MKVYFLLTANHMSKFNHEKYFVHWQNVVGRIGQSEQLKMQFGSFMLIAHDHCSLRHLLTHL